MGNSLCNAHRQHAIAIETDDESTGSQANGSCHQRESSLRRFRRWASRLSFRAPSGERRAEGETASKRRILLQQQRHQCQLDPEVQKVIARRWNRESRKRIRRSTLINKFAASKAKWPVPYIESLFLPDFPVLGSSGSRELEDFEVLDVTAAGSFGNVLKVRGDDDKKLYALKVVDKARLVLNGHAIVQQSKSEVSIQMSLGRGCFVASLLRHWQTRKRLYLLLEYVPNGELFALWKLHGKFSESLARFYVAELACALDFIHRSGVVYRDLKLENVVMDAMGHLVLIDFGLSKWLRSGQTTRTLCGTLVYSAPEMLGGHPYDHSVDWWSLGVLFFALVSGKFPVTSASSCREMSHLIRRHEYRAPSQLTLECRYTLEQLLQKCPSKRIRSLDAIAQSPFFKGRIDFSRVASRSCDPQAYHTQMDLSARPGDRQHRRLTQRRPAEFNPEEEITTLIEDTDGDTISEVSRDFLNDSYALSSRQFCGTQL